MPASIEDYEDLARKVEYVVSLVNEVNAAADTLRVPIPQPFARAWADFMVWPAQIREEGARRTAEPLTDWLESAGYERHDEPPDLEEQ